MKKSLHREDYKLLLRLLYEKRMESGLKQEELAGKLGVHQSFISKTENGERRIDVVELKDFCDALNISLSDLIAEYCRRLRKAKN